MGRRGLDGEAGGCRRRGKGLDGIHHGLGWGTLVA